MDCGNRSCDAADEKSRILRFYGQEVLIFHILGRLGPGGRENNRKVRVLPPRCSGGRPLLS
jgi:hypothetical protein